MYYPSRGYPMSTRGLSPIRRCIELRQRAMLAAQKRPPLPPLWQQRIDNLLGALNRRGTAIGWWDRGNQSGGVSVSRVGGGFHANNMMREYVIRGGHIVRIMRLP